MLSTVTVASSTRMPTASASPPSVITFRVSPKAASAAMAASTESGIETITISVDRHEPRNSRIISAVRPAAIAPSRTTPLTAAPTNSDWSASGTIWVPAGSEASSLGSRCFAPSTIARVEVAPFLSTLSITERCPSTWTTLVCGALPSFTWATSRMVIVAPFTTLIGRALNSSTLAGALFSSTLYWLAPTLMKPIGLIWVWAASASETSCADRPFCCSATGSRSTCTCRCAPPEG